VAATLTIFGRFRFGKDGGSAGQCNWVEIIRRAQNWAWGTGTILDDLRPVIAPPGR
jgi:hypothetical protein